VYETSSLVVEDFNGDAIPDIAATLPVIFRFSSATVTDRFTARLVQNRIDTGISDRRRVQRRR
jgi:hypothetical protein